LFGFHNTEYRFDGFIQFLQETHQYLVYVLSSGQIQFCEILGGALLHALEALKVNKKETNAGLEVSLGVLCLNMIYVCRVVLRPSLCNTQQIKQTSGRWHGDSRRLANIFNGANL
jgi:hypothetical protein